MPRDSWKNLLRLYVAADLAMGREIGFNNSEQHYITHVMRRKTGDSVLVFNGRDGEWRAVIAGGGKKQSTLACQEQTRVQASERELVLLFAPIKRDHLEYLVQKGCELGVSKFCPVLTQHTTVQKLNIPRLEAIAREAAEQSERLSLPIFEAPLALQQALAHHGAQLNIFACLERGDARPVADAFSGHTIDKAPAFLIGPEGGFSADELAAIAAERSIVPISLGPRILRADTAALSALSCWQAMRGDWRAG